MKFNLLKLTLVASCLSFASLSSVAMAQDATQSNPTTPEVRANCTPEEILRRVCVLPQKSTRVTLSSARISRPAQEENVVATTDDFNGPEVRETSTGLTLNDFAPVVTTTAPVATTETTTTVVAQPGETPVSVVSPATPEVSTPATTTTTEGTTTTENSALVPNDPEFVTLFNNFGESLRSLEADEATQVNAKFERLVETAVRNDKSLLDNREAFLKTVEGAMHEAFAGVSATDPEAANPVNKPDFEETVTVTNVDDVAALDANEKVGNPAETTVTTDDNKTFDLTLNEDDEAALAAEEAKAAAEEGVVNNSPTATVTADLDKGASEVVANPDQDSVTNPVVLEEEPTEEELAADLKEAEKLAEDESLFAPLTDEELEALTELSEDDLKALEELEKAEAALTDESAVLPLEKADESVVGAVNALADDEDLKTVFEKFAEALKTYAPEDAETFTTILEESVRDNAASLTTAEELKEFLTETVKALTVENPAK